MEPGYQLSAISYQLRAHCSAGDADIRTTMSHSEIPKGFFAPRVGRITVSASNAGAQRVRELRAQGRDIIGLTIGEPDFETPGNIKDAATAAMGREETKYTDVGGTPELKAAIRAKFKRENNLDYAPEQIMAGNGGKQVIFNAIMSTG